MLPISRILVPVDFSERGLRMLPYVRTVAEQYKAEIILLHVVNPVYVIPATGISGPIFMKVPERVFTERAEQLNSYGVAELKDLSVRRVAYEGDPEAQIAAFCKEENVQLVIMPTHGYGAFRRYLLGSISAKVLHDVDCPVLTGAHVENPVQAASPTFSKVVCAVDLTARGHDTLTYASKFASDFNATLSVVHVMPEVSSGLSFSEPGGLRRELQSLVRKEIEDLRQQTGAENIDIEIREGDIAHEVSDFVHSAGAGLLIIGRGAHENGAGRLRTNAYAIIRQSPCPVLSV